MVTIVFVYISIIFTLYSNSNIMASGGDEEEKKELVKKKIGVRKEKDRYLSTLKRSINILVTSIISREV